MVASETTTTTTTTTTTATTTTTRLSVQSVPSLFVFAPVEYGPWASSPGPQLLSVASSDDCAHGGDTSSSRSLRPWPRRCTTPHEDRGRPGQGRRRARRSTRPSSGRLFLPGQCSSVCATKSLAGAWQSRRGHRCGFRGTPWSSLANLLPWCRSSMLLCRSWWTSWKMC